MKTPQQAPKLARLADGCYNGACNVRPLLWELRDCVEELPTHEVKDHPAIRYVLDHLTFLCGTTIGPSQECHDEYVKWREQ